MNRILNNFKLSSYSLASKVLRPFNNRKALTEEANSGISFSTSLIVTLIGLTVLLGLFTLFLTNAKEMQNKEKELRQKENDSISLNTISDPSYKLPNGFAIDLPNC